MRRTWEWFGLISNEFGAVNGSSRDKVESDWWLGLLIASNRNNNRSMEIERAATIRVETDAGKTPCVKCQNPVEIARVKKVQADEEKLEQQQNEKMNK